jgi:hypothetical protein
LTDDIALRVGEAAEEAAAAVIEGSPPLDPAAVAVLLTEAEGDARVEEIEAAGEVAVEIAEVEADAAVRIAEANAEATASWQEDRVLGLESQLVEMRGMMAELLSRLPPANLPDPEPDPTPEPEPEPAAIAVSGSNESGEPVAVAVAGGENPENVPNEPAAPTRRRVRWIR